MMLLLSEYLRKIDVGHVLNILFAFSYFCKCKNIKSKELIELKVHFLKTYTKHQIHSRIFRSNHLIHLTLGGKEIDMIYFKLLKF